MMDTPATSFPSSLATPGAPAPPPEGWAVPAGRGVDWWGAAWRLFTGAPAVWILITIIYVAIMMLLSFIPLLGQLGVSLLNPVFLGGIMLGCREQDRGGALTVQHLFAGFKEKLGPLVVVALLYLLGWFVVGCLTLAIAFAALGGSALAALASGDATVLGSALFATMGLSAALVLLVGLLFAAPLMMAFWFAPALVMFRGDEPFAAMKTSFRACLRNIPPFLVYGLLGILFIVLACIPVFLGLIVLIPVGIATVYTSYKDIFGSLPETASNASAN
jgi:uncharacterized membrane protein